METGGIKLVFLLSSFWGWGTALSNFSGLYFPGVSPLFQGKGDPCDLLSTFLGNPKDIHTIQELKWSRDVVAFRNPLPTPCPSLKWPAIAP